MCYREEQPHPHLWAEGLPADAPPAVALEHERNLRSSPYTNCKRGDEIETGDWIVTGHGMFFAVGRLDPWNYHLGLKARVAYGIEGARQTHMIIAEDVFYQLTGGCYAAR